MEAAKVVVRYANGKVIKGFTQDFFPNKDRFHLRPLSQETETTLDVQIKDLKAVFFVQNFDGNAQYAERKVYGEEEKIQGRKVEDTFTDGEILVGSTLGYDPQRQGFFLFPADPKSNNVRLYAVSAFVKKVRYL
jgi:hypothetical protein